MTRFYQIARLTEGKTILLDAEKLRVNLDSVAPADLIENDVAFQAAIAPQTWFWLSGGGTLLLNGHYLPIVRRASDARVNPGKFSLFTGRADNTRERAQPDLMVRELFEELLLFEGGTLLVPQLEDCQGIIDTAYKTVHDAGVTNDVPQRPLPLTRVLLKTRPVAIRYQGVEREYQLSWTAGATNDVNVLYLLAAQCDLPHLTAQDGEFRGGQNKATGPGREIYLYNFHSRMAHALTRPGDQRAIAREDMTEALRFLEDLIV